MPSPAEAPPLVPVFVSGVRAAAGICWPLPGAAAVGSGNTVAPLPELSCSGHDVQVNCRASLLLFPNPPQQVLLT